MYRSPSVRELLSGVVVPVLAAMSHNWLFASPSEQITCSSLSWTAHLAWKPQAPNLWVQVSNNLQLQTFRSSSISSRDAGCWTFPDRMAVLMIRSYPR
ncbi:hypothetical protein BJV77DRAFT_627795 [Russula vinacea]|nr:hypothetical protein BJV77DRAFT_627795 [Russula vinacea]